MTAAPHVVVLAAGEGKRLKGKVPKVLVPLWGRPSVAWTVEAALSQGPDRVVVVAGAHEDALRGALEHTPAVLARQTEPKGTGHAVLAAAQALAGAEGPCLILYGDGPLVTPELLSALLEQHQSSGAAITLVSVELDDPTGYGRVLRGADGAVQAIVEEKDATPEQRAIREVNAGLWIIELPESLERLAQVGTDNAQGEVYLTDLVELSLAAGRSVSALAWPHAEDVLGFNDQRELATVRGILRDRILDGHLANAVEIVDPASTFIDADVQIEAGVTIQPCTMIEGRCRLAAGAHVGPFAHLRDGTVLEAGARVGNFTETKQTTLGAGAKANHLTYLGNTTVGAGSNIGAGTITANYDGVNKHPTVIGERVFIGSGSVLVAPTTVGDDAMTGAGAIVTRKHHVAAGEVWVGVPARPLPRTEPDPDTRPEEESRT